MTPRREPEKLKKKVLNIDPEASFRTDYTGRGMFTRHAAVAFDSSLSPHSEDGKLLVKLGFSYDNMGRDWIYYATW